MTSKRIENIALKKSRRSDCLHMHSAIIVVKGHVVSIGHNRKLRGNGDKGPHSIHAEVDALRTVKPGTDMSKAEMYVSRFNKNGGPLLSKPCDECILAIRESGIRKVHYSLHCDELVWATVKV